MGFKARGGSRVHDLGDQIALRPINRRDSRELFGLVDANRDRLRQWMPWVDSTTSVRAIDGFVAGSLRDARRGVVERFVIVVAGEIAGIIGLEDVDHGHRRASIGYWIDAASEGRGIMTRAVIAVCDHGFGELGLNRIEIHCGTENWRSRSIPERLGFTNEGVLREREWINDHFVDHALYAMLAADWRRP